MAHQWDAGAVSAASLHLNEHPLLPQQTRNPNLASSPLLASSGLSSPRMPALVPMSPDVEHFCKIHQETININSRALSVDERQILTSGYIDRFDVTGWLPELRRHPSGNLAKMVGGMIARNVPPPWLKELWLTVPSSSQNT